MLNPSNLSPIRKSLRRLHHPSHHRLRLLLTLLLPLALPLLPACGDETGDFAGVELAGIIVTPTSVIFDRVGVGEVDSRIITIENNGGGELIIASYRWTGEATDFALENLDDLRVPANSTDAFTILYSPSDEVVDDAVLTLETNAGTVTIEVTTLTQAAILRTNPVAVELLGDDINVRVSQEVQIFNAGTEPLTLSGISLITGSSDFDMVAAFELPLVLGAESSIFMEIGYAPSGRGSDDAVLLLEHDAANADQGASTVDVTGALRSPVLTTDPPFVGFGFVEPETTATQTVSVINDGQATLVIRDMFLSFDTHEDIRVDSFNGEPFTNNELAAEVNVPAGESAELVVSYTPTINEPASGIIHIISNDPDFPDYELGVGGRMSGPFLVVEPGALNFGNVATGYSRSLTVLVRNAGDVDLELDTPEFLTDGDFTMVNGDSMPSTLGPDEAFELVISFSPIETGNRIGQLNVIPLNDEDHNPSAVYLEGLGAGAPYCELIVSPSTINFGLVPRGSRQVGRAAIRNIGPGQCVVQNIRVGTGFDFSNSFGLEAVSVGPSDRLGPGDFFTIDAYYAPTAFTPFTEVLGDTSSIDVTISDPDNPGENVECGVPGGFGGAGRVCGVNLQGRSGIADVEAIPSRVDFGLVTRGCNSQVSVVRVYNTGSAPVHVSSVALEGCSSEFNLTNIPPEVATPAGYELQSGAVPMELWVTFRPANLGETNCNLVIESDAETAGRLVVPIGGEGTDISEQVDHFEQISGRSVDVLFVVDNSGSMSDEQSNLVNNFGGFILAAQTWGTDFQIGVITTEPDQVYDGRNPGELMGSPRILIPSTASLASRFSDNALVGDSGAGARESGLEAAHAALSDPLISDVGACGVDCEAPYMCVANASGTESLCGGYNRSFIREDASLEIVFVSDEEDQSRASLAFYTDFFRSIKGAGNTALFHANAIVGPRGGCSGSFGSAEAGNDYLDLADATGGVTGSICDSNFSTSLENIGNRAFGLRIQWELSRAADPTTVVVTDASGSALSGWTFDEATNSVVFTEATVPQPGESFDVRYTARCF